MWLAKAERITGNSAGTMNGDGSRKLLLHATEGGSIAGAVGAYTTNNSWPHLTVDCPERRIVQHLPLDVPARSLRNAAGGQETNRDGKILVQIEMVGFAGTPATIGSKADLEWFGREVVAPIARLTGVPLTSTVRWVAYPASFGKQAAQRLHGSDWDNYSGVCGHQHADENDHGDPGAIDIATILSAARGEDDDMALDPEERKALIADIAKATGQVTLERINDAYRKSGSVVRTESRVLARLGVQDAVDAGQPLGDWLSHFDTRIAALEAKLAAHDNPAPQVPDASPSP